MNKSKILFITRYSEQVASARFRVVQYLDHLHADGFTTNHVWFQRRGGSPPERWYLPKVILGALTSDIIFIQKKSNLSCLEWNLFRLLKRKLIFDFDDALYVDVEGNPKKEASLKKLNALLASVDVAIVSCKTLRQYAEQFARRVVIIPTPVDPTPYPFSDRKYEKEEIVIGWSGSSGGQQWLSPCVPAFNAIAVKYPNVRLKVVSSRSVILDTVMPFEFQQWRYEDDPHYFSSFDIGLMPLLSNPRTEGKASLKALAYMASGIPTVVSPVGMNAEVIVDGLNGFWASMPEEWISKLSALIESPNLRKMLGTAGRQMVMDRYTIDVNYLKLRSVLESVSHKASLNS